MSDDVGLGIGDIVAPFFDPFDVKGKAEEALTPNIPKRKPAPKVKPMPVADDQQALLAKRRSAATQRKRSGRASTILTNRETLG